MLMTVVLFIMFVLIDKNINYIKTFDIS